MLSARKPGGTLFVNDVAAGDGVECKHCRGQFWLTKRNLKRAGYCLNCDGFSCPKPECYECPHPKRFAAGAAL